MFLWKLVELLGTDLVEKFLLIELVVVKLLPIIVVKQKHQEFLPAGDVSSLANLNKFPVAVGQATIAALLCLPVFTKRKQIKVFQKTPLPFLLSKKKV